MASPRNKLLEQRGRLKHVKMSIQWLSQLFCRRKRQYRNSSARTAIEVPLETTCTSPTVPRLDIHDIADKTKDEDWTTSIVQEVMDRGGSNVLGETTDVIDKQDSRLLNLPDDVLLIIIKILYEGSDKRALFAFFVLRQVSQKFRALMRDNMFISRVFSDSGCCEWCAGGYRGKGTRIKPSPAVFHCFENKIVMAGADIRGLGALIRRERICKTCRPEFESRRRKGVSLDCKFAARTRQDWLYCFGCNVEHPTLCFSSEEVSKQWDRVCIARTGYIRMCSHQVFSWDEMQASLGYRVGDDRKFRKVCKHPSHRFHDHENRDPPYAEAEGSKANCFLFVTSGIHSKEDLDETYFQRHGINGGSLHRNHILPVGMVQMARDLDGKSARVHDERMAGETVSIFFEDCLGDYECHKFRYIRTLMPNASGRNIPGHSWFHAISPESYSYAGPRGVPETCSDPLCRNHYSSGLRYRHADGGKKSGYNHIWREKR